MTSETLAPQAAAVATRTWSTILFDLDGTLIDSGHDITTTLAETFARLGRPVPSDDQLRAYVGPPLLDVFRTLEGFDEATAQEGVRIYRELFADRMLRSPVFPGIRGLLERLHALGVPVALATSKPEPAARRILDHTGLAPYFTVIGAASADGARTDKADVVAFALDELRELGVDVERPVLVGDRSFDVIGGRQNGVPTIIVEWGYGSPAEADGALAVVHSTDQLRALLTD